jgi:CRISPR-associated exonuclease Cas4
LTPVARVTDVAPPNTQTPELFGAERAAIAAAAMPLQRLRPSDHDPDRAPRGEAIAMEPGEAPETELPVGAGRVRGLILHKLMEEMLTGELAEEMPVVAARARVLMTQLIIDADNGAKLPTQRK